MLDPDAVIAFEDDYFSARDDAIVDDDLDRVADGTVQLHDRAGVELQDVPQRKLCASERNADRKLDLHEEVEGLRLFDRMQIAGRSDGCARFLGLGVRGLWRRKQHLEVAVPSYV